MLHKSTRLSDLERIFVTNSAMENEVDTRICSVRSPSL
jgi:hypothetical protein